MASIRTFIAVETPESIRKDMSTLQAQLKKSNADVRWEHEEKFHATVKFLGEVDEKILPSVIGKIEEVVRRHRQCEVVFETLGCFPNVKNPRVIWIGCTDQSGELGILKSVLDKELQSFGFEIEQRPFKPHITLGRVKESRRNRDLISLIENLTFEPHESSVTDVVVMKSVLKPQGSEYSILQRIQLNPLHKGTS